MNKHRGRKETSPFHNFAFNGAIIAIHVGLASKLERKNGLGL